MSCGVAGNNERGVSSLRRFSLGILAAVALAACGGGGGSGGASLSGVSNPTYTAGTYKASSTYAGHCAAPRSGTSDVKGSITWENFWLRSWTHELYLWYSEVPDLKPADYSTTDAYFQLMKTTAVTSSGKAKDPSNFHFSYSTDYWNSLSQSGVSAGYGVEWAVTANARPRVVVAAYTDPGTPATNASITRGARVMSVDGVDIVNDDTLTAWPEGLFPDAAGESHTFVIQELNGTQRTVTMTSADVTETPVQNVKVITDGSAKIGYLLFNDHIATAEQELIDAFTTLSQSSVNDLVLDLRYNGGGYLAMASEVAYMIAGSAATGGKTFERLMFNSQYASNVNPVTGGTNSPTPFYSTVFGFAPTTTATGTPLPTLNLLTVYVITGKGTCSASEAIINGLRGAGVQVVQIGSTTCGKPYGFYPQDNCGTTYFSIEFQGVNDIGFGSYADGFSPQNTSSSPGVLLPGCSVADDFMHALGDPLEGRLASALYYRTHQPYCSTAATGNSNRANIQSVVDGVDLSAVDGEMYKGPWRENRIMTR